MSALAPRRLFNSARERRILFSFFFSPSSTSLPRLVVMSDTVRNRGVDGKVE